MDAQLRRRERVAGYKIECFKRDRAGLTWYRLTEAV